jgi:processive 1,2-diacylglycerol beta-glucosyltransferase
MRKLYDRETNTLLGSITEEQFQFLVDQLEEESPQDTDYYINRETLELFAQSGADPHLLALLQRALGEREAMEIRWDTEG